MAKITSQLFLVLLISMGYADEHFVCQKGQFLVEDQCQTCPDGTFMSQDNHKNVNCKTCTAPDRSGHEKVVRNCTSTHDTQIGCMGRYFRVEQRFYDFVEGECQRCTDCSTRGMHTARECDEDSDTVCCPRLGMAIQRNEQGTFGCI